MSGNAKIRKLMNTPSASSARISPIVQDPIEQRHDDADPPFVGQGDEPEHPAGERALAGPDDRPRVAQQVQDRLDPAGLEQVLDRRRQLERAAGERPVRDDRRVEVPLELGRTGARERPDERRERGARPRGSPRRRPGPCCGHVPARR